MRITNYLPIVLSVVVYVSTSLFAEAVAQNPDEQLKQEHGQERDESGYYLFPRWDCSVVIEGENAIITYTIKTNKSRKHWDLATFEPVIQTDPDGNTVITGEVRMTENPGQENYGKVVVVKTVNLAGIDKNRAKLDVGLLAPDGSTSIFYGRKKRGLKGYEG